MQIKISTRHGHLSAGTQEKLSTKLSKLSRFSDRLTSLDATVDLEHPESPRVELRASVAHAEPFVATDKSESLLGSVDAVIRHEMPASHRMLSYEAKVVRCQPCEEG